MEIKPLRRKSVKAFGSVAAFSDDDVKMAIADFKQTERAELPVAKKKLPVAATAKRVIKTTKEFI